MRKKNKNNLFRLCVILGVILSVLFMAGTGLTQEAIDIPGGEKFLEGRSLQLAGQWAASLDQFRAAADVYSIIGDYALYQMAQSALQKGDTDGAASALEELLNFHPDTPIKRIAQLELINLHFDADQPERALQLIEAVLPGAQSSAEIAGLMLMLAKAHIASGDFVKSDRICWQLIHGWSSKPEALQAAELARQADTPERRLAVGKVYVFNKKARKAIDILDGLMADPEAAHLTADLLLYKAQSLGLRRQKQESAELYRKILTDYPDSSSAGNALSELGDHKRSLGQSDEALADYARLVDLFPRNDLAPSAIWKSAKIFEKLNDPAEYDEYERLLSKYPRSYLVPKAFTYWGVKLYLAGDYAGAKRVFEKLEAADINDDTNASAAFWMAKCAIAEGKTNSGKIKLAGVIKRFDESYHSFRARSILETLSQVESIYSRHGATTIDSPVAFEVIPFVSLETESPQDAFALLEGRISGRGPETSDRLRFLMLSQLPEAKWELTGLSRDIRDIRGRYALAWALFQAQTYNDSLKVASTLRNSMNDETHRLRVKYLLYPPAYPDIVFQAASKYEIDPMLTLAVTREESHFGEDVISVSDARGLMQIIPSTGEWLAGKVFGPAMFDRTSLFKPSINIELGSYYLRYLLNRFDNNIVLALAAYNWGEGNLKRWMDKSAPGDVDAFIENIPADETRRYVKKVLRSYAVYHSLYPSGYLSNDD